MTISWQKKLYFIVILVAVIPSAIITTNILDIIQDELTSNTNSELRLSAERIAGDINNFYKSNLVSNLVILQRVLENQNLGSHEKVNLLVAQLEIIENFISFQVLIKDKNDNWNSVLEANKKLNVNADQYDNIFTFSKEEINQLQNEGEVLSKPKYFEDADIWISSLILPLNLPAAPTAYLGVKFHINSLVEKIEKSPSSQSSKIYIVDKSGNPIFNSNAEDVSNLEIIKEATNNLKHDIRVNKVMKYADNTGDEFIGCYAYPENLDWVVVSIIEEESAYIAVYKITSTVVMWILFGLIIAVLGGVLFSRNLGKPIKQMAAASKQISSGNFDVKIDYRSKDSIGLLKTSLLDMSAKLKSNIEKITQQNLELDNYSKSLEKRVEQRTEELHKSNEDLKDAYMRVLDLNNEKNEFLSIAAHDLKNPIGTVKGYAEFILDKNDLKEEEIREYSNIIIQTSERMLNIISGLLDINEIEDGGRIFELEEINLASIVINVLEINAGNASQKNILISFENDNNTYNVYCDISATEQIIDNIISNAIKFSGNGKNIFISISANNANIIISIKDEGPGFTEKDRENLYRKFAKLSARPTAGENSTGLGLSIVKKLADLMNVEIECISEHGIGTEFKLYFPIDAEVQKK
ncbi:MAG: HAMP domain-containing protein [Bacteroidetes bacterium]|nr:HAMP domain-containing protein [Bacteroidota bacterium]